MVTKMVIHKMIAQKFLIALVALGPAVALAQWPDAPPPPPSHEEGEPRPRQFGRFAPPSASEIDDAMVFMQENAPNRWQAIQMLPDDDSSLRRNVIGFVVARYRALQGLKDDDSTLYDIKVQQLRTEDEVYGLLSGTETPERREKLRQPLTDRAQKMQELTLAEREQRIHRLKDIIEHQEASLSADRLKIATLVSARVEALINEGQAALREDRPMGPPKRDRRRDRPTTQPEAEGPAKR